jgi:hypothetical protein
MEIHYMNKLTGRLYKTQSTRTTLLPDRVVILVDDLKQGIENYSALGFNVIPIGKHAGTECALIPLRDGSFLELVAFERRPNHIRIAKDNRADELLRRQMHKVNRRVESWRTVDEGLVDFCLQCANEKPLWLSSEDGPVSDEHTMPDGTKVTCELGLPDTFDLPFLCSDITARDVRVPSSKGDHLNGAVALKNILVLVTDMEASIQRYRSVLNLEPTETSHISVWGVPSVDYIIGETVISLIQPTDASSDLHDYLALRGEGPYGIRLRTTNAQLQGVLKPSRTHGAWIEMFA